MVLTLRRLISQFFGSDQVEQVDGIRRSGAEQAAQRLPEGYLDKRSPAAERTPPAAPARDESRPRA